MSRPATTRASKPEPTLLVGDIGGTNTRLSLYERAGTKALVSTVAPSRDHATLEDIARPFLASAGVAHPIAAVLGIAGPVRDGVARVTNLPWVLDESALARHLGIPRVRLVNDLVAVATGCLYATPSRLAVLGEKKPAPKGKNVAVIAAGTGLGEARLLWDGERHVPFGSEGGHGDFAPRTPIEVELWHFLGERFPDHVSYERVLSGDGLGALYDFFTSRASRVPRSVERRLAESDRNQAIAELGLARTFRPAARAVDAFVTIYGAEAGNLALRELALGGVFVAGNIGRTLVPARKELFLQAFRKKGRFAGLLSDVPVAVVTDPMVGVRGALALARDEAQR